MAGSLTSSCAVQRASASGGNWRCYQRHHAPARPPVRLGAGGGAQPFALPSLSTVTQRGRPLDFPFAWFPCAPGGGDGCLGEGKTDEG